MADLKRQLHEVRERAKAPEMFFEALRNGTDQESSMLLARLRTGQSIEDMARSLETGSSHLRGQGPES